jgi:hypothetical protein
MKYLINLVLVSFIGLTSFSNPNLQNPTKIQKYQNSQQGTIELSTHFGKPLILNKEEIKLLRDKKIYHIDLVYTAFRTAEDFDQLNLNENRIEQLLKLLPQIDEYQPNWSIFEQVGAKDRETAKEYFHGFVIHFGKDLEFPVQSRHFETVQVPFAKLEINNQEGGTAKYYSGSIIQMEKDIVYHQNGRLVQGYYQLHYREFRNQAEIALSGIPMRYKEDGKDEIFNSVGMYEIRAFKDGEELVLKQAAIVNFQCTEALNNVDFYAMDDDGDWTKLTPINAVGPNFPFNEANMSSYYMETGGVKRIRFREFIPEDEIDQGAYQGQTRVTITTASDKDQLFVIMSEEIKRKVRREMGNRSSYFNNRFAEFDTSGTIQTVLIYAKDSIPFLELMTGRKYKSLSRSTEKAVSVNEGDYSVYSTENPVMPDSQLVKIYLPKEMPTATAFVAGLASPQFGVYNCDQTRRLKDPIALRPTYFDKKTGERLENLYVTCVIDLDINASLSYHPNHLFCNSRGNTKLVVISDNNEIYLFEKTAFSEINMGNVNVEMKVVNITDKVESPDDLKRILGV